MSFALTRSLLLTISAVFCMVLLSRGSGTYRTWTTTLAYVSNTIVDQDIAVRSRKVLSRTTDFRTESHEREVLLVNAWVGSVMPDYFPKFIQNVHRNPSLSFLMVSTYDTPEFCPQDGSESIYFPSSNPNVKVHCSSTAELIGNSSISLCEEWNCDEEEVLQVTKHFSTYVHSDPQAWNNLKPVYATIFQQQMQSLFPNKQFSHWLRVDLDLYIGDWNMLFPKHLLEYDVFTFQTGPSFTWEYIYLKGYVSGFRLSPEINSLWTSMRMYRSPKAFREQLQPPTPGCGLSAADEGAMSVNILRDHPEVSFIVEPDLLAVDLDLAAEPSMKILYDGDHRDILRVPITVVRDQDIRFIRSSPKKNVKTTARSVGHVEWTQDCDMGWLQAQDRLCAKAKDAHQAALLSSGLQVRVARAPGQATIHAWVLPSRGKGLSSHVLFYHFQVTKRAGLRYDILKPGVHVEISHEQNWRMRTIASLE